MRGYAMGLWGQVHYRRGGNDGPDIVLFHESPLSSLVYEPALQHLPGDVRGWAFDTPGYGNSDPPPTEQVEIPDYAAALLRAIDDLGIGRFIAVGTHTGASLAVQVAVQAPHRVSGLVLSGVPLFTDEERSNYLASWAPPVEIDPEGGHLDWAWRRYQRIWGGPPALIHMGSMLLLQNHKRYHWAYNAAFRYDPEPDLKTLEQRTLFFTAEADLLIESDREAVTLMRDATLETVPNLPGQLPLRVSEQFSQRVVAFCRSVST